MKPLNFSYLLVAFATLTLLLVLTIAFMSKNDNASKLPPKGIMLTQTFSDIQWLRRIARERLAHEIENETERSLFLTQADRLKNHTALEEATTGRLSSFAILRLKSALNEFDKLVNRMLDKSQGEARQHFVQYVSRIKQLSQRVDYLEIAAS